MKVASDAIINKIVQKMKSLIEGKADSNHKHNGVYAAAGHTHDGIGELTLVVDERDLDEQYVEVSSLPKLYVVEVYSSNWPLYAATICVDYYMLPTRKDETPKRFIAAGIPACTITDDEGNDGDYQLELMVYRNPNNGALVFETDERTPFYIRSVFGYK